MGKTTTKIKLYTFFCYATLLLEAALRPLAMTASGASCLLLIDPLKNQIIRTLNLIQAPKSASSPLIRQFCYVWCVLFVKGV